MPMAITRLGGIAARERFLAGATTSACGFGTVFVPPARLAILILSMSWKATGSRWPAAASRGLATKSMAQSQGLEGSVGAFLGVGAEDDDRERSVAHD